MKVFITGGAGFIGSHLCDALVADGHEVLVLDNLSTGSKNNISHLEGKIHVFRGDITDQNLARLVAQCDIKNDISRIVNFEFVEALGFAVPVEKVDGENKGLRHSFQIKEDAFAQGVRTLVNHKTYYFVAVAYAFNEFKKYIPTDPLNLE